MFKMLFAIIIVVLIVNHNDKKSLSEVQKPSESASTSTIDFNTQYAKKSDLEKSELYFNHRIDMLVRKRFPDVITWQTTKSGISLKDQAIEVIISLPENKKERIWLSSDALVGSFHITNEEVPAEISLYDSEPDEEIRNFLIKYAGVIDKKINFALEKKINYAYFEFRNGESKELMQKISDRLTSTLDGVMCQLNMKETKLELNIQNMLDE